MAEDEIMKIALPVMLHSKDEIKAYQAAKGRIEKAMAERGISAEVGVFNYLLPFP